jgi:hypothetical protein
METEIMRCDQEKCIYHNDSLESGCDRLASSQLDHCITYLGYGWADDDMVLGIKENG